RRRLGGGDPGSGGSRLPVRRDAGARHGDERASQILRGRTVMADTAAWPLARFSVLDLTRARAGPTCVRQRVDWGGRAIKIEIPGGRGGDGMGGNRHGFDFQNLHRNKRAMTLNLRDPEGGGTPKGVAGGTEGG